MTITQTSEPQWLSKRRATARERLATVQLPTKKDPGWEFTNLADFTFSDLPAAPTESAVIPVVTPIFALNEPTTLVQVDGNTATHSIQEPPESLSQPVVLPLQVAVQAYPELIEQYLGKTVTKDDIFVTQNDANWSTGIFVFVPAQTHFSAPLNLQTIQTANQTTLNWRTLIVLEAGAEAEIWDQQLSSDPALAGIMNSVTEIHVGQGARLRYISGQNASEQTWLYNTGRAEIKRDGQLEWVALGFGGRGGKVRMETKLAGPGAHAKVTGAYAAHGRQHIDFDTTQEHATENTTSDLAFRGVLTDRSTSVWRGMIRVDEGAGQTDAFQESRNLLLSRRAHADAIPGLEIEANDVRCTHAAAIAQIDPEQLFYLRSRGLPTAKAHRLVVDGFLQELVERFPTGTMKDTLAAALANRLMHVLSE